MSADDDELSTVAYTRFEWDCPGCNAINSCESDPSGETVECEDCGAEVRIEGTR